MSYRKKKIKHKVQSLKKLRPKTPFFKKPIFWIVFCVVLICFLLFYVFVASGTFEIKNIIVLGNQKIKTQEINIISEKNINKKILSFLNSKSIFLADTNSITKTIESKYPEIETVSVEKKLPNTLTIKIKERKAVAVFCQIEKDCYSIDLNGVIFDPKNNLPENMPVIRQDVLGKYFLTGEQAVDKISIATLFKTETVLKNDFQINIKDALITNPLRLNLTTNENWQIYFDLGSDTNFQINKLNLLLKNEISEQSRKSLQYIDLRFKDRAYYK
jgi:cell division septal protein FtsQ